MSVLDFSKRLNYLMQTEKISQRYLSNQTGLQRKSILNWLNAKFYPRYDALITLADFFCQCTDYIVGRSDDESKIVGPIEYRISCRFHYKPSHIADDACN